MSVQSEITRLTGLKDRIGDKLTGLGVATAEATMLGDYTEALESIAGVATPAVEKAVPCCMILGIQTARRF